MSTQKGLTKAKRSSYEQLLKNAQRELENDPTPCEVFEILFKQKFDIDDKWQKLGMAGIDKAEDKAIRKLVKYCHKKSTLSRDKKVNKYAKRILDLHYSRSWAEDWESEKQEIGQDFAMLDD